MTDESGIDINQVGMEEVRRPVIPRKLLYAIVMSFVVSAVLSFVAVFAAVASSQAATVRAVADSERKWCALLVPLDETYKATPPPTPTGREFARTIHKLRSDFGCEEG